ncbi:hypothetical protein TNCV_4619431 [Trichonephila clavipes]|nr:hypothetical protein TNCV_4619431 [Trichonephila clavipes]
MHFLAVRDLSGFLQANVYVDPWYKERTYLCPTRDARSTQTIITPITPGNMTRIILNELINPEILEKKKNLAEFALKRYKSGCLLLVVPFDVLTPSGVLDPVVMRQCDTLW